jgi:hypothetical protein
VSIADTRHNTVDAGLGTEASVNVRDFDVLLSVLYARPFGATEGLRRSQIRFSVRTIR